MTKVKCNKEHFEYEFRTYYTCDLVKGHRGKHKHHSVFDWD